MKRFGVFIMAAIVLILSGCSQRPSMLIKRPWTRIVRHDEYPGYEDSIKVRVEGATMPLLGDEILLRGNIKDTMVSLLGRRGYSNIVEENPQYEITIKYRIEKSPIMEALNMATLNTLNRSSYSSDLVHNGYGVYLANNVSIKQSSSYGSTQSSLTRTVSSFDHVIYMEIKKGSELLWQADVFYNSTTLNLMADAKPLLQRLLSGFPRNENILPQVKLVKKDALKKYYYTNCEDIYFSSPALPYRIYFENDTTSCGPRSKRIPNVSNPEAFEAYLDLIQTAEIMLPAGVKKFKSPYRSDIWKKARLGGAYLLGKDQKKVNVLIDLTGNYDGYQIKKCRVVSDEEYTDFKNDLKKWEDFLEDYFDFYE